VTGSHRCATAQTAPRRSLAREVLPPRELADRRRASAAPALLVLAVISAVAPGVEHVLRAAMEDPRRREVDAARLAELIRQLDALPGAKRPAESPAPPQAEPQWGWQPATWWSGPAPRQGCSFSRSAESCNAERGRPQGKQQPHVGGRSLRRATGED
jgi:hypothetical protein